VDTQGISHVLLYLKYCQDDIQAKGIPADTGNDM